MTWLNLWMLKHLILPMAPACPGTPSRPGRPGNPGNPGVPKNSHSKDEAGQPMVWMVYHYILINIPVHFVTQIPSYPQFHIRKRLYCTQFFLPSLPRKVVIIPETKNIQHQYNTNPIKFYHVWAPFEQPAEILPEMKPGLFLVRFCYYYYIMCNKWM